MRSRNDCRYCTPVDVKTGAAFARAAAAGARRAVEELRAAELEQQAIAHDELATSPDGNGARRTRRRAVGARRRRSGAAPRAGGRRRGAGQGPRAARLGRAGPVEPSVNGDPVASDEHVRQVKADLRRWADLHESDAETQDARAVGAGRSPRDWTRCPASWSSAG